MEKTLEQLEDLIRKAALAVLKLPRTQRKAVRFPYGSTAEMGDAPSFSRTDKLCFIYLLPAEDDYSGLTEVTYRNGGDSMTRTENRANLWQANFVCYGPTAYEWVQRLRSGLLQKNVRDFLLTNGVSIIPNLRITRAPEMRDGEWWTRFDLSTTFYEAVRTEQENSVGIIENVRITSATEKGSG